LSARHTDPSSAELEWICRAVLQAELPIFKDVEISARFYPYIGLTHTIRRRAGKLELRISDHCRHAPRIVLESIALLLGYKIMRKRPPKKVTQVYTHFRQEPEINELSRRRRLDRGRKYIGSSEGRFHSLTQICRELNLAYFNNQVEIRKLGWGPRKSWVRLGHYDPVHNTITISPVLDSPEVPRFVVAYILYHELLHTLFSEPNQRHHPPEYQRAERTYPDYKSATKFLREFCRNKGKTRRPR
jgi:hypothetical protein